MKLKGFQNWVNSNASEQNLLYIFAYVWEYQRPKIIINVYVIVHTFSHVFSQFGMLLCTTRTAVS